MESSDGTNTISYTYDADGLRTSKTVNGVEHTYYYAGGKLLRESFGSNTLDFFYDSNGNAYALKYNGTLYYYITNLQGDVMSIVDAQGAVVASYEYDPYGNLISNEPAENTVGHLNPLRYRGYYYDSESELYYLQSRYYDPEIGRFLNADVFTSTGQGILGNNMFAYCLNNPVCLLDSLGAQPTEAVDVDGDGEIDYYIYAYTYTCTVYLQYYDYSFDVTVSGNVYIFPEIGGPGGLTEADMPEGFNPAYDLLVGYYTEKQDNGEDNAVMYAFQAHKTTKIAMKAIINVLKQYDDDFGTPWERTERSLFIEWNAHRAFSPFDVSAQNVDFDNVEEGEGYLYFCYKAFCRGWDKYIAPHFSLK